MPRPIVALANFGAVEGERLSCSATVRYTECSVLSGELKNPMARLPVSSIKPSASLRESKERMSMTMLSWVCAHARAFCSLAAGAKTKTVPGPRRNDA